MFAGILFKYSSWSNSLENKVLDLQFQYLRNNHPVAVDKDVIVVGIDEQTFRVYREPMALWHPHLGKFFNAMAVAQPSALGLDVVLPDRSYDFLVKGNDKTLLAGLIKLKSKTAIVLGQTINEKKQLRPLFAPLVSILGKDALGLVLVQKDSDGKIRRLGIRGRNLLQRMA